jgi:hypothetical protein
LILKHTQNLRNLTWYRESKSRSNSPEGTPESDQSESQRNTTEGPQSQDDASPEAVIQTATVPPKEGRRRLRSRTGAATTQGRSREDEVLATPATKVPSKGQRKKKREEPDQDHQERLDKIRDSLRKFKKTEERRRIDLTRAGPVGRPPDDMDSTPLQPIESPTGIASPLDTPTSSSPTPSPTPPPQIERFTHHEDNKAQEYDKIYAAQKATFARHGSVFDSKGNAKVVSEVKVEVDKKAKEAEVEVEEKEVDDYDINLDQLKNKKESKTFNQTVQDQINQLLTMAEEAKERAQEAELETASLRAQNHELRHQFNRQRELYQTRENQTSQSQGRIQVHDKGSHKEQRPKDLQCAR